MAAQTWTIDTTHSGIHFTVRHMVFAKVRGTFAKWSATFAVDEAGWKGSSLEVRIQAASIDTKEAQRDGHLRSPDFLDAEKHPEIVFTSKRVEPNGETELRVLGDLTIRGVTREVTLDVERLGAGKDPWGNRREGFAARGSIDRKDFGLAWNQVLEAGGVLVGDKVEIDVDVEAVRPAEAK